MEEIAGGATRVARGKNKPKAEAIGRFIERYPAVQLATLVDKAPEGDGWVHEIKFDGYRLLGFFAEGE